MRISTRVEFTAFKKLLFGSSGWYELEIDQETTDEISGVEVTRPSEA